MIIIIIILKCNIIHPPFPLHLGKSDGHRVHTVDFAHYVNDIIEHVSIVRQTYVDPPLYFIGLSMVCVEPRCTIKISLQILSDVYYCYPWIYDIIDSHIYDL